MTNLQYAVFGIILLLAALFWPDNTDDDEGPGGGLMQPAYATRE